MGAHSPSDPVRKTLRISVLEGMLHAAMLGLAESYLGALAVELGHQDSELALLATIPLLVGSSAQLLAGPMVAWLGGRKRLVVCGAVIQAISHLGFAAIAWTGCQDFAALLVTKAAYWISGMLIGPPWGAWMASLIDGRQRERYFAWRSGAVQGALLGAFGLAGWLLYTTQARGQSPLGMFAVLNGCAVIARGLSATALALQHEVPGQTLTRSYRFSRVRRAASTSQWKPALYVALLMFGAHLAVPFFTPYMLRNLALDYADYASLLAVPIVTKAAVSPLLYSLARRLGMRTLLALSTALVSLVALLWSVSTSYAELVGAQLVSGIAWGAFEYANYQLLLSSARPKYQVEFLSLANSLIGTAQLSGALVGAQLLTSDALGYQSVFQVSAVARALPIALAFFWIPKRVSALGRLFWRVLSVLPAGGTLRRPIVPSEPAPRDVTPPEAVSRAKLRTARAGTGRAPRCQRKSFHRRPS